MGRGDWAKRTAGKAVKQLPLSEFKDPPVVRRLKAISLQSDPRIGPLKALIAGDRRAIGRMGATEFAPKIRKRYQTNELGVDSTEFGTRGSEVQILSPRPNILQSINCGVCEIRVKRVVRRFQVLFYRPTAVHNRSE